MLRRRERLDAVGTDSVTIQKEDAHGRQAWFLEQIPNALAPEPRVTQVE